MNSFSLSETLAFLMVAAGLALAAAGLYHGAYIETALALPVILGGAVQIAALFKSRKYLSQASAVLDAAADGHLDHRIVLSTHSGPMGRMNHAINRFLDLTEAFIKESDAAMAKTAQGKYFRTILLDGLVGEFQQHAQMINGALHHMEKRSQDYAREASDVGASARGLSDAVAGTANELEQTARHMSDIAGKTSAQSAKVALAAEDASQRVRSVADATERMSSDIRKVSDQIRHSASMAGRTMDVATETENVIQSLREAADAIVQVVDLIHSIAGQTNLLALNATIEAVRAGEAGKGFVVVAHEVKTLAGQTAHATEDVTAQIDAIRSSSGRVAEAVGRIVGMIREINENSGQIADATQQQMDAVNGISTAIRDVAHNVEIVASTISEVSEVAGTATQASGQVLSAAGNLSRQTSAMNGTIDEFIARVCQGRTGS